MLKHVWLPEFQIESGPQPGTFDWWQNRMYDDGLTLGNLTARKKFVVKTPIGKKFGVRQSARR